MVISLFILIFFVTYFCVEISGEDALLVKYIAYKFCIFLMHTGKHYMCNAQNQILSDVKY